MFGSNNQSQSNVFKPPVSQSADDSVTTGSVDGILNDDADKPADVTPTVTEPTTAPAPATPAATAPASNDLLGLKQEALQQLHPLVGHLDQSPEEKFRTLMMMIQASDDHTKLNEAFDAAKKISDDKARAQALLDVINEINYFTQQNKA